MGGRRCVNAICWFLSGKASSPDVSSLQVPGRSRNRPMPFFACNLSHVADRGVWRKLRNRLVEVLVYCIAAFSSDTSASLIVVPIVQSCPAFYSWHRSISPFLQRRLSFPEPTINSLHNPLCPLDTRINQLVCRYGGQTWEIPFPICPECNPIAHVRTHCA
jgi:Sec7-like guanine-nucleotide exchange factor